ncbi:MULTISPECIES: PTS galactitol transporter subunit IIA [Pasteurellaceae]|uniref:PTS galactitol transporter subunit IIA n=1 Tax=Pasteurellaceae TaxID=712 RepID=UPI0005095AE3
MSTEIFIKTNISFSDFNAALNHIADELLCKGIVKQSYRAALFRREADFPTGIALEHHAVAIPHCEAEHALKPAIYFIRPQQKVAFQRADEDSMVDVEIIIALVVTDPQAQLNVLKTLFGKLQDNQFVENLLTATDEHLPILINQHLNFN